MGISSCWIELDSLPNATKILGQDASIYHHLLLISHPSSHLPQYLLQKVLKGERDEAVTIVVVFFKRIRHALERDARLHKQVETEVALGTLVVLAEQDLGEAVAKSIPERVQCLAELLKRDVAAVIAIKPVKQAAPLAQKRPQSAEFVESDGAAAIAVKHADHHTHGLRVKGGKVAVDECEPEFPFSQLVAAYRWGGAGVSRMDSQNKHLSLCPFSATHHRD